MTQITQKQNWPFKFTKLKLVASLVILAPWSKGVGQTNAHSKINIGLGYPVTTNWTGAPTDTNKFSLNLLLGISAAERGLSMAGISNVVSGNTRGLQIAGVSNHVGKNAGGTMIAGLMNTYSTGNGLAMAGAANISRGTSGPQVSGLVNKASDINALQISGFLNIAQNVRGFQASGFLNVAKKVKGIQLSFINVADSATTQIGIVNITRNGEKAFSLTVDESQTMMLAFRSGGKTFYGIVGTGYNFGNKRDKYAFEAGLGLHFIEMRSFRLNTELVAAGLQSLKGGEYYKSSLRLLPTINITPKVALFGGPSFNYMNTNTEDGKNMTHQFLSSWTRNEGRDLYGFYVGYTAGIQVSF